MTQILLHHVMPFSCFFSISLSSLLSLSRTVHAFIHCTAIPSQQQVLKFCSKATFYLLLHTVSFKREVPAHISSQRSSSFLVVLLLSTFSLFLTVGGVSSSHLTNFLHSQYFYLSWPKLKVPNASLLPRLPHIIKRSHHGL